MNEDFVTFEQAVKLKELGFDWECISKYNEEHKFVICAKFRDNNQSDWDISAPTLSQAQKWLREVKGIDVHYDYGRNKWTYYWGRRWSQALYEEEYDTPIDALSAGIDKVLEYLKGNEK